MEGEGWPASLANFPLGQWIADNRRFYACGRLDQNRIERLEKLGMVVALRRRVGGRFRGGARVGSRANHRPHSPKRERNFR
ncbi:helicase associated protein [Streptomyces sp. T12]|nr:helicase associated protein [Streptomyces sp. T12]